ncbi:hypothetical protein WJX72_001105 [[Myrmecia] bisecta]|uniref:Uncharacterized protein n=1 Tax=[Myrmecia] bisecta TaxID=41462 RepID=A0AAW1P6L6_9CHLO
MNAVAATTSSFAGTRVVSRAPAAAARAPVSVVRCQASPQNTRRQMLSLGAVFAAVALAPKARADLTADLLAKTEANLELNNRKRLATSYANLAGSRTVDDGTCTFPRNLFGCDNQAVAGNVKFITEDRELECQGKDAAKCASKIEAFAMPKAFNK